MCLVVKVVHPLIVLMSRFGLICYRNMLCADLALYINEMHCGPFWLPASSKCAMGRFFLTYVSKFYMCSHSCEASLLSLLRGV